MAVTVKKRCEEIELFRFVFCLIITLCHADKLLGENICFPGGAFGVEFFFLVSGYLMMAAIDRKKSQPIHSLGDETLHFIKRKLSALYPEVPLSLLIAFVIQCAAKQLSIKAIVKLACNSIFELLLLSHSGLGNASLIGPIWYLSTMILAMMILYPLIRKYQDTMVKIVLPLTTVFLLGFLIKNYNHFRTPGKWLFFAYKGFLRGMGEIMLGTLLYWATKWLQSLRLTVLGKGLLTVVKWTCWILVIVYTTMTTNKYDAFFLVVLAVAIISAFSNQCLDAAIYENKSISFLGKFSLPLYLNHRYFSWYLGYFLPDSIDKLTALVIYVIASVLTACFVMAASHFIRRNKSKLCGLKKLLLVEEVHS